MPLIFSYLLKLSFSLMVMYLFYLLLLRRLTFYNWNRWYLLGYSILSFMIPFVNISLVFRQDNAGGNQLFQFIPALEEVTPVVIVRSSDAAAGAWNLWDGALLLLLCGIVLLVIRLLVQLVSYSRIVKKATLLQDGEVKVYQVDQEVIPFSFGRSIFINRHQHAGKDLEEIIRHEFVHVKQRHSLDIIWSELLCILNWYNPFAWLLRAAIRQNLEFIADNNVVRNGADKKQYQYLLLKVIGNNHFSIAQHFNYSSLKKRIAMMNKMKSAGVHLVKFLFILPLVALLLVAFRNNNSAASPMENGKSGFIRNSVSPVKKTAVADTVTPPSKFKDFRLNKVSSDFEITDKQATIKLLDGTIEKYDLTQTEQRAAFEKKYGKIVTVAAVAGAPGTVVIVGQDGQKPIEPGGITAISTTGPGVVAINKEGQTAIASVAPVSGEVSTTSPVIAIGGSVQNTVAPQAIVGTGSGQTVIAPMGVIAGQGVTIVDEFGATITGKEDVLITITSMTTREQLEDFKKQMEVKGIELNFDNIDYNDGKLVSISGTMKSADGKSNFVATDFSKVILSMIKDGERTYFKVSVQDKKERI